MSYVEVCKEVKDVKCPLRFVFLSWMPEFFLGGGGLGILPHFSLSLWFLYTFQYSHIVFDQMLCSVCPQILLKDVNDI